MSDYIHGRADAREAERLEKQAHFAAPLILERFDAPPGSQVLDLATGVGAMVGQLQRRFPDIQLTGVDLRAGQLAFARRNHPEATYVQADARSLPFPDQSFDRVHASWFLEHVRDPLPVLREVHRVLRPGGYCQFTEVDNATFDVTPRDEVLVAAMDALNRAQIAGGGDPFIGQKLEGLMKASGFARVSVRGSALDADANSPEWFRACTEEFAEIFESLDEALGPLQADLIRKAAGKLRALPNLPNAHFYYRSCIARADR